MYTPRIAAILGGASLFLASAAGFAAGSKVRDYRYDPRGGVSGVVLDDGTEIVGMAGRGGAFTRDVSPGDDVQIVNGANDELELFNLSRDRMITLGPREMVALEPLVGPPVGGGPPSTAAFAKIADYRDLSFVEHVATISMILRAPDGAPSGFLLDDGTQVHMFERVSDVLRDKTLLGAKVRVDGYGTPRAIFGTACFRVKDHFVYFDLARAKEGVPELGIPAENALTK